MHKSPAFVAIVILTAFFQACKLIAILTVTVVIALIRVYRYFTKPTITSTEQYADMFAQIAQMEPV